MIEAVQNHTPQVGGLVPWQGQTQARPGVQTSCICMQLNPPSPSCAHPIVLHPGITSSHLPLPCSQVIVIDEIGTEAESLAARTIAQRGVQLIATAHGNELENVVKNPSLADLIGGIQTVTLGAQGVRRSCKRAACFCGGGGVHAAAASKAFAWQPPAHNPPWGVAPTCLPVLTAPAHPAHAPLSPPL